MKVSCIQMDVRLGRPEENHRLAEQLIREAAAAEPDVILLPELWEDRKSTRLNSSHWS